MAKTDGGKKGKPYSKPTLVIYGGVRELTKTLGAHQMSDGGSPRGVDRTSA
jgi:hypothetical protein